MKEEKNPEYKEIISNLDNFVMIKWENDETIIPRESSHFGFYVLGQDNVTEPLEVLSIQWSGGQELSYLPVYSSLSVQLRQFTDKG